MRNTISYLGRLALMAVLLAGCGSSLQMDRGSVSAVCQLEPSQYEIIGDVVGEANVTMVFFFIPIGSKLERGTFFNAMAIATPWESVEGQVRSMAIYNAIENSSNADMVIAPRFESHVTGLPPLFWTTHVKVKGKGLKLK
ncbi:MAG: hypothetical protein FJY67_10320 [Calditrichaeota bacterium]|nr:hypothetical protein [Calditrichota bacterium]